MAAVFAGFVIGYAIALFIAPAVAIAIVRTNDRSGLAQQIAPPGTNVIALAVVVHFAAIIVFTALGLVLGMALAGISDRRPDGGIGSPNLIYTLLVVALTATIVIPMMAVPLLRRFAIGTAIVFAALFGWAMPWLAKLGQ